MVRYAQEKLPRVGLVVLLGIVACAPDLDDRTFLIVEPRFLGIRSVPAEVAPGGGVGLEALFVGADGERVVEGIDWALCNERKPLAILGPVSPACMEREHPSLEPLGSGAEVQATIPGGACRVFGPSPPAPAADEPPGRPYDPDETGGYFQPSRALVAEPRELVGIGRTRITCGAANANIEGSQAFLARYRPNVNPAVGSLRVGDVEVFAEGSVGFEEPFVVAPSERVELRVDWEPCDPDSTADCTGAEQYVYWSIRQQETIERRESIRVSWFVPEGEMDFDRTGREEEDEETFTDNVWTASSEPGEVRMWVVIRDGRGGTAWESYRFRVE